MYSDLRNYKPSAIEYALDEEVKEAFPLELDFSKVEGVCGNTCAEAIAFVGNRFSATFPSGETAMRRLDDYEISNIREEYCVKQEHDVPKRKAELETALEKAKAMKKRAEEAYNSALMEVAKYAAEVRQGTKEVPLHSKETFCIALSGHYLVYTFDREKGVFVLAKAFEVPDRSELWANDEKNRMAMREFFGLEFPEPEPQIGEDDADDLPFGDEDGE